MISNERTPVMIPAGWMAKRVSPPPVGLHAPSVTDVLSVSGCISEDFADWIRYWKHNGFWLFDSPQIIRTLALDHGLDLAGSTLFYYEVHPLEYAEGGEWRTFAPEPSLPTQVVRPGAKVLEGWDVVTFSSGGAAECSPLSCNGIAADVDTNTHCLLKTRAEAIRLLETGAFAKAEPGPYRVFAVHSVPSG